jgi:hypothetical protein
MNKILKSLTSAGFALLFGMTLFNSTAIALTPDGETPADTPANEGVCDVLMADGITKGLYGLCVAYCEAQDLDQLNKEPPNTKILDNYNKKKQATDPGMPCVATGCPCWTDEQLALIVSDNTFTCSRLPFSMTDSTQASIQLNDNTNSEDARFAFATVKRLSCANVDLTPVSPDPDIINQADLTKIPTTAEFCLSELDTICGSIGQ